MGRLAEPGRAIAADLVAWRHEYDTLVEAAPTLPADIMVFDDVFAEDPNLLHEYLDPLDFDPAAGTHERTR